MVLRAPPAQGGLREGGAALDQSFGELGARAVAVEGEVEPGDGEAGGGFASVAAPGAASADPSVACLPCTTAVATMIGQYSHTTDVPGFGCLEILEGCEHIACVERW